MDFLQQGGLTMGMTYKRFLEELEALNWKWRLTKSGVIQCKRKGKTYSPLSAMMSIKGLKVTEAWIAILVANHILNMRPSIVLQVDEASCVPDWRRRDVRADLIRATHITSQPGHTGSMRLRDFLRHLRHVRVHWCIEEGRIRGRIRGKPCCPITAVAEYLLGEYYVTSDHRRAAHNLGLRNNIAHNLAESIDNGMPAQTRKALLHACGLSKKARR